jgi:hypothetical protein
VYDGPSDTVYTFTLGSHSRSGRAKRETSGVPALSQIVARLTDARKHASISQPTPGVIAGEPAYTVRAAPLEHGGLLGAAELAWDASHGVPLRVALYARGQSTPTVEIAVTDISFGSINGSVFAIKPPAGAKTVDVTGGATRARTGTGSFTPNAPASLNGKARSEVKRNGGGAVVLYGNGLDTIAVIEHEAGGERTSQAPKSSSHDGQPLELPSVSINGAKATALGTPLGGVVSFERGGVSYTVVGSQPLSVLQEAARGL